MQHPTLYAPPPRHVARTLASLTPFTEIHRYCTARGVWPGPDLAPAEMAPIAAFQSLDLPDLTSLRALACLLYTSDAADE